MRRRPRARPHRPPREPRRHWDVLVCGYCGKSNKTGKRGRPIKILKVTPKRLRTKVRIVNIPICRGCVRDLELSE